jgi:signal transduction histidine kinase
MSAPLKTRYFRWMIGLLLAYLAFITITDVLYQFWEWVEGESHSLAEESGEIVIVIFAGLLALPVAAIMTIRLSTRMLQPLAAIRETAERIIAGSLHERVKTDNPGDELGLLGGTLNKAFDRYHDAVERQQRFASDASHQLRTPLTSIRAAGEVCLQKARTPDEYRETIGSMLEDVQRLSDLIEKLLMLARLGADKVRTVFTAVDLSEVARRMVAQYESISSSKEINVQVEALPDCRVSGDSALLEQMLGNLFDNALRHTPPGGQIRIRVAPALNNRIALFVRDNGPGVDPQLRQQLFQRFARGAGATDTAGNGLGLAIVADIVNIHSGMIELLNEPGAAFRIALPRLA